MNTQNQQEEKICEMIEDTIRKMSWSFTKKDDSSYECLYQGDFFTFNIQIIIKNMALFMYVNDYPLQNSPHLLTKKFALIANHAMQIHRFFIHEKKILLGSKLEITLINQENFSMLLKTLGYYANSFALSLMQAEKSDHMKL